MFALFPRPYLASPSFVSGVFVFALFPGPYLASPSFTNGWKVGNGLEIKLVDVRTLAKAKHTYRQ